MSTAPDTLKDLRRFLVEQTGKPTENFGIRGVVTPRRPWGFHLGRGDIYGPGGMGDKDYSVRHSRNKAGLTDASAGFDIKLPKGQLQRMAVHLVELAKSGKDRGMLFEVIGPDAQGEAKRWAFPNWKPKPARKDHRWHIHLSFFRDTELMDKRWLFADLYGTVPDDGDDPPLEPDPGDEPIPDNPEMPEEDEVTPEQVKELQRVLNRLGVAPQLVVDGSFGPLTEAAMAAAPSIVAAQQQAEVDAHSGTKSQLLSAENDLRRVDEISHKYVLEG